MTSEFIPALYQAKQALNKQDLIKFNHYYWYYGAMSVNNALNMAEINESYLAKYLQLKAKEYLEYALLIEKIENLIR